MEDQLNFLREKLSALSYNDVRKEAKNYSISARGKKIEIIDKILEIEAERLKENVNDENVSPMDVVPTLDVKNDNLTNVAGDEENVDTANSLNDTYTLETPNDEEDFLSEDESNSNFATTRSMNCKNVKNVSLMSEDRSFCLNASMKSENLPFSKDDESDVQLPEVETKTLPLLSENVQNEGKKPEIESKLNPPVANGLNRFERQHKKLFDEMESIADAKKKMNERVQKNNAISNRLKELASPKKQKVRQNAGAQFTPPADPSTLSFKFGDVPVTDYPKVQKSQTPSKKSQLPLRRSLRRSLSQSGEKKMDVKQMTMSASRATNSRLPIRKIRQATTPVLTPRLERLATPKGKRISLFEEKENSRGSGYQPHKGRFEYVDTTKMSDQELKEYLRTKGQ